MDSRRWDFRFGRFCCQGLRDFVNGSGHSVGATQFVGGIAPFDMGCRTYGSVIRPIARLVPSANQHSPKVDLGRAASRSNYVRRGAVADAFGQRPDRRIENFRLCWAVYKRPGTDGQIFMERKHTEPQLDHPDRLGPGYGIHADANWP